MLMSSAKINGCPEHEKYVAVIFDEMHIRADLVYNKNTGELVGFCEVGDVNNNLLEVEKSLEENHQPVRTCQKHARIYGEKSVRVIEIPLCTVFHQRHLGGYPVLAFFGCCLQFGEMWVQGYYCHC